MAETAVARRGASIALACRAFGVSETCYRYGPKLRAEKEEIADLLVGLTVARKTWGGSACVFCIFAISKVIHGTTNASTGSPARWS